MLFAQASSHLLYYVHVPVLLVLISLVYSATRFDQWNLILREALRWGLRLLLFLVVIVVVLYVLAALI
ncbi:MAG TPA: hypothetical protein VKA46_36950 [Gemmataceae bacterium]|nr:hypothetical protein [Gemmataceae bacterium]